MASQKEGGAPEQSEKSNQVQEKVEDVMKLWLNNESVEDIMPVVDELFDMLPVCDWGSVLSFLPPKLCTQAFLKFLEKPGESNRSAEIAKQFAPLVQDMKFDEQTTPKRSTVYLGMHTCLKGTYLADAHQFLVKYLSTFNKVDDTADVEGRACEAVLNCLKLPIWEFDEVMDLVPVRGLRTSKNNESKLLLQLLELFSHNGVNEWTNFVNDNKALVEDTWGLDQALMLEKIRLLSLCRMAHNNRELSFKAIGSCLSINEDEVEGMIIQAVATKLMQARVDQVDRKVTVSYSHHSLFSTEQWRHLQHTLSTWKDAIAEVSSKLETAVQEK